MKSSRSSTFPSGGTKTRFKFIYFKLTPKKILIFESKNEGKAWIRLRVHYGENQSSPENQPTVPAAAGWWSSKVLQVLWTVTRSGAADAAASAAGEKQTVGLNLTLRRTDGSDQSHLHLLFHKSSITGPVCLTVSEESVYVCWLCQ